MLTILEILEGWEALSQEEQSLRFSILRDWINQFELTDPDYHLKVTTFEQLIN